MGAGSQQWFRAKTAVAQADSQLKNVSAPWQWVRLSPAGGAGSGESIRLPALERNSIDRQWLESLPSPIPDNVVQALDAAVTRCRRSRS